MTNDEIMINIIEDIEFTKQSVFGMYIESCKLVTNVIELDKLYTILMKYLPQLKLNKHE